MNNLNHEPGINEYKDFLCSNDPKQQLESTHYFHSLLCAVNPPPIQEIIDINAVPRFVQFLSRNEHSALQLESVKVLNIIVKNGTLNQIRVVMEAGTVSVLVQLLSSWNEEIRVQAALAIGDVSGSSEGFRDIVLAADALSPLLLSFNEHSSINTLRSITFAISRLCYGKRLPVQTREQTRSAIPLLTRLLSSQETDIMNNSCVALGEISNGPTSCIDAILQANTNVVQRLTEIILGSTSTKLQTSALKIIGNIAADDESQAQYVIDALPSFVWLLDHPDKEIRKEVYWTLSNITAGTITQIQAVIDAAIFPKLFKVLKGSELKIRKEVGWIILNTLLSGSEDQVQYIINEGFIPLLCSFFQQEDNLEFEKEIIQCLHKVLYISEKTGKLEVMLNIIYDHGVMDIIGKILADAEKHDFHINALNIARYYYRVNMKSDDPNKQLIVLHYFRYRLTLGKRAYFFQLLFISSSIDGVPPIQEMIDCGIITHLIRYLNCDENPLPQSESASALVQIIGFGTSDHRRYLIEAGVIPILIRLLSSSNEIVRAEAAGSLANIANVDVDSRDIVLAAGALPALILSNYNSTSISTIQRITFAISNLFFVAPLPDIELVRAALPVLCDRLLLSQDDKTVSAACYGLCSITEGSNEYIQSILNLIKHVIPRLMELLRHTTVEVIRPALLSIGYIGRKEPSIKKVLRHHNIFQLLLDLLDHPNEGIRDDTCWVIANLTESKSIEQIQEVIDVAIFPKLFQLLNSSHFGSDIQVLAIPLITKILRYGTPEQVCYLVQEGIIPLFCGLLKQEGDMDVVQDNDEGNIGHNVDLLMKGIKDIIKKLLGEPVEKLEDAMNSIYDFGGINIINQLLSQEDDSDVQKVLINFIHQVNMTSKDLQK